MVPLGARASASSGSWGTLAGSSGATSICCTTGAPTAGSTACGCGRRCGPESLWPPPVATRADAAAPAVARPAPPPPPSATRSATTATAQATATPVAAIHLRLAALMQSIIGKPGVPLTHMFPINVPNVLTLLRILLLPVLGVALLDRTPNGDVLAAVVFAVASLTDAIDGYLARSRQWVTTFGKLMDPVADKLLVIDRKSTRLNSSHANISYAVFCLKK